VRLLQPAHVLLPALPLPKSKGGGEGEGAEGGGCQGELMHAVLGGRPLVAIGFDDMVVGAAATVLHQLSAHLVLQHTAQSEPDSCSPARLGVDCCPPHLRPPPAVRADER